MYFHPFTDIADPLTFSVSQPELVWSLLAAAVLGALLGIERSVAGKQAGMRTYALVSMGSCLFVIVGTLSSALLSGAFPGVDPLRIASSIVVGIGFIGSGIALARRDEHVELTTASGIWVAAGVGMACGFGLYLLAFAATVFTVAIFSVLLTVENKIRKNSKSEKAQ